MMVWLLLLAMLVAMKAWEWRNVRRKDRMLADFCDFARRFPDRCIMCSLHRYGVEYGFQRIGSKPEQHRCSEEKR